jgi:mono/diheme cytochrome c family protein
MKTIMKWTLIVTGGLIGLTFLAGVALYPTGMKKLSRTYPDIQVETVAIPGGAEAVARGRHIAIIRGCTKCHGEDLSGSLLTNDAILGTIPAPNLTSGKGGIGGFYSDTDWVRALRHGVKPDGRGEALMNNYSTLSDQDLGDLIAYLRQIPPVDMEYPTTSFGPIIPLAPALGLFTPAAGEIDHEAPRPADPVEGATVEYGSYLFTICTECHSTKVAKDVEDWSQEDFMRAFQTGVLPDGKPLPGAMSLKTFGEMNEMELKALWLYLQSLPVEE